MIRALELLYALGVLDDDCCLVRPLGVQIAEFPVEPQLAKMLLSSFEVSILPSPPPLTASLKKSVQCCPLLRSCNLSVDTICHALSALVRLF
jgi:HrpA-like RNA helicase